MGTTRPPPTPPGESRGPRQGRRLAWWARGGAVAASGLAAAAWLLGGDGSPGSSSLSPFTSTEAVARREPTAAEVTDPDEQRRLSELEERRGRYASLRTAFGGGAPPSPVAQARLGAVLSALWPPGTVAWSAACTGQLCRIDAPPPAAAWQGPLAADPRVAAIAERVVVDPDGGASPAYLVLVPAGASPGASVLDAVEEEFRTSTEIRECLSRVGATGNVEYAVTVDTSGYSYRQRATLPPEALDCADRVLGEMLDRHPPPRPVQTATRTFTLRR